MTLPPIQQYLKKLLISITGCEFDKDGSLVDWGYEHGRLRLHESEITELTHHLELREEAVKREAEKRGQNTIIEALIEGVRSGRIEMINFNIEDIAELSKPVTGKDHEIPLS